MSSPLPPDSSTAFPRPPFLHSVAHAVYDWGAFGRFDFPSEPLTNDSANAFPFLRLATAPTVLQQELQSKFAHLKAEYPAFVPIKALHNAHGLLLFGWEKGLSDANSMLCFWAVPNDPKVILTPCFVQTTAANDQILSVRASDDSFVLLFEPVHRFYLNGEDASSIPFPTSEYTIKGGATVRDETHGVAEIIYSEPVSEHYQENSYLLLIKERGLFYPATGVDVPAFRGEKMQFDLFMDEQTLYIKVKDLASISLEAASGNAFYVRLDREHPNDPYILRRDRSHEVVATLTTDESWSRTWALMSCKRLWNALSENHPDFSFFKVISNKFGSLFWGYHSYRRELVLYWAPMNDAHFCCSKHFKRAQSADRCDVFVDFGSERIQFTYDFKQGHYLLEGEKAHCFCRPITRDQFSPSEGNAEVTSSVAELASVAFARIASEENDAFPQTIRYQLKIKNCPMNGRDCQPLFFCESKTIELSEVAFGFLKIAENSPPNQSVFYVDLIAPTQQRAFSAVESLPLG